MKFKPMPRFSRGVVQAAGDAALDGFVGRMFIQPRVDLARGQVLRLDEVLGSGFALLTWQRNLLADTSPALRAALLRLGCSCTAAARSKSLQAMQLQSRPVPGVQAVEDHENALHFWFQKTGADWVLLRPDRYVAAIGRADDLERSIDAFCRQFVPESGPPAPRAVGIGVAHPVALPS